MKRHPLADESFLPDLQMSRDRSDLPTSEWRTINNEETGRAEALTLSHTILDPSRGRSLAFSNPAEAPWEYRNAGNGLTFTKVKVHENSKYEGYTTMVCRWAGWAADKEIGRSWIMSRDGDDYKFLGYQRLVHVGDDRVHVTSDAGALFSIYTPTETHSAGTALILTGFDAGQHTRDLVNHFTDLNWSIIQVYNLPVELNFEETIQYTTESTPEELGRMFAQVFEKRHGVIAGATDAALAICHQQSPSTPNTPLVIIGISAGALYAPAVAALHEPDASVIITGGAPILRVMLDSSITNWAHYAGDLKKLLEINIETAENAFLAESVRDPYHTAPLLDRETTLIVHASSDGFVPHKTGDTLWERARRPERWVFPGGHAGFFFTFDLHADDIARWIRAKTAVQMD